MTQGSNIIMTRSAYRLFLLAIIWILSGCDFSLPYWLTGSASNQTEYAESKADDFFDYSEDPTELAAENQNLKQYNGIVKEIPADSLASSRTDFYPISYFKSLTQEQRYQLSERHAAQRFEYLNYYLIEEDGLTSIALNFSSPLNPEQDFSNFISVIDLSKGKLPSHFELSDDLMSLNIKRLPAERNLIITLAKELVGINARSLMQEQRIELSTPRAIHAVGFLSQGTILPLNSSQGLPIFASNVKSIDLNFYKIDTDKLADFYLNWKNSGVLSLEALNQRFKSYLNGSKVHYSTKVELNDTTGYRKQFSLLVQNISELQQSGVYVVLMNETGSYSALNSAMVFMLSDIGIIVHRYEKEWQIALQSLNTGEPLENVAVELFNQGGTLLYQAYSDAEGWLKFPAIPEAVLLVAHADNQMSLLDLQRDFLDLSLFNLGGVDYANKQLVLLDPYYQPQKELTLNGLLRSDRGELLANQTIGLKLYDAENKLRDSTHLNGVNGFYQYHYLFDDSESFGTWRAVFDLGGVKQIYLLNLIAEERGVKVKLLNSAEEITLFEQPIEYDVTVSSQTEQFIADSSAEVIFSAQRELVFAAYPDFMFGMTDKNSDQTNFKVAAYPINRYGEFNFIFNAEAYPELFKLPVLLFADINLIESNQVEHFHHVISRLVWPDKRIYGVRPFSESLDARQSNSFKPQSMAEFEVIAINPAQQKVMLPAMLAKLVKEKQEMTWRWHNELGWIQQRETKDIYLSQIKVQHNDKFSGHVAFPIESGDYRIELYHDERLVNSFRFSTCCRVASSPLLEQTSLNSERLPLSLKRTEQGLQVMISSELSAQGAIFIESSKKVLFKQRISTAVGQNSYIIPIDEQWDNGDSYVSVWVLSQPQQLGEIKRYLAIQPLPVKLTPQEIQAVVDFQEELSLGKEVNLYMNLYTATNKPKQVSALFSFVAKNDQTNQSLAGETPRNWLFEAFLAPRRYQVKLSDIYNRIINNHGVQPSLTIRQQEPLMLSNKTRLLPIKNQLFLPKISVNEMGIAKFKLILPEQQGEFYLVGQIWSDNQCGTVRKEINLLEPYLIEITAPERLLLGDQADIIVNITSQSEQLQPLNIQLSTLSNHIVFEPLTFNINLAPHEQQQLRFALPPLAQLGEVRMQLDVITESKNKRSSPYKQLIKLQVDSPYPKQYESYAFNLPEGETWYLPEQALQELIPETVAFDVLLTDGVPLTMLHYLTDLAEVDRQALLVDKVSILFSWLGLGNNALKLGIISPTDLEKQRIIQRNIDDLIAIQLPNGGFPIHALDLRESPWTTVYFADLLSKAQQQQYKVPDVVWNKLLHRIKEYTHTVFEFPDVLAQHQSEDRSAVNGYAALLLAKENRVTQQELLAINQIESQTLSGLPMLQLGIALELLGERSQSNMLITLGKSEYRNNEWINIGDYGSSIRDRAQTLALLAEYQIEPTLLTQLASTLSRQVLLQQQLSESEKTALFFVARALQEVPQQEWRVELNDNPLISSQAWQYRFTGAQSAKRGLFMTNRGEVPLQVRVYLSGHPKNRSFSEGESLQLEQQFYTLDGKLTQPELLQLGDKVIILVSLHSKGKLTDVLLEDNFAAGLSLDQKTSAFNKHLANLIKNRPELEPMLKKAAETQVMPLRSLNNYYRALLNVDVTQPAILFFIATATHTGKYHFGMPRAYSLSKPQHNAVGKVPKMLIIQSKPLKKSGQINSAIEVNR